MRDPEFYELSKYRIDKAHECLEDAKIMLSHERYPNCATRSYYAMFHAMRAVLALDGLDFKKHSAVMGKFRERYIKTKIFDVSFSKMIGDAFDIRGDSDYEDFFLVEKEEVVAQLQNAEMFVAAVKTYVDSKAAEL